jgi:SAM-dependent methyltransferase
LPENIRDFYQKNYRLDYKGVYIPKLKHVYRAGRVALDRYRRQESCFPKGISLLDIGSGGGEFLYLMTKQGLKATGVEPNTGYAEYSRQTLGLNVLVGFAQDLDLKEESFDVITIWHVLEHLEDPADVLKHLAKLLKANGKIVIEVPNIESIAQAPKSTFHLAHLYNFSKHTLSAILAKNGFKVLSITLTQDGGNMTGVFQKEVGEISPASFLDPSGAEKLERFLLSRSQIAHYLRPKPYLRLLSKIRRSLAEKKALKGRLDAPGVRKVILDDLYGQNI